MSKSKAVFDQLQQDGASGDEIDDFFDFCTIFKDTGKVGRYEVYRLWARLLRYRITPFKKHSRFHYEHCLKDYLRYIFKGEIIDAEVPDGAITVTPAQFVKFVVKHLDESL